MKLVYTCNSKPDLRHVLVQNYAIVEYSIPYAASKAKRGLDEIEASMRPDMSRRGHRDGDSAGGRVEQVLTRILHHTTSIRDFLDDCGSFCMILLNHSPQVMLTDMLYCQKREAWTGLTIYWIRR